MRPSIPSAVIAALAASCAGVVLADGEPPSATLSSGSAIDPWPVLQRYLPALLGADAQLEFARVGAYAAELEPASYWRGLSAALDARHGDLGGTCAGSIDHFVALLIDDPTRAASIGRPEADVRVFWIPLARISAGSVNDAIRTAALVDGVDAARFARTLRYGRSLEQWSAEMERSPIWFLPAGDDPSIHPRRIRGFALARAGELVPYLVYIGTNMIGNYCEVATTPFPRGARVVGTVHSGAQAICQLPGLGTLAECSP